MTTIYQFFSKARTRSSGFARVLSFLMLASLWCATDANAQTRTVDVAGSGTYNTPAGATNLIIQAWGAGGGGGIQPTSRYGGGGGAYATRTIASPNASYSFSVGAGGAATSNSPSAGGDTWFGGTGTIGGGNANNVIADGARAGNPANGGLGSQSFGSTTRSGGNGGDPTNFNGGGGGGASASLTNNGGNGGDANNGTTGGSGGTTAGAGDGPGGAGGNTGQPGAAGTIPGGGGGAGGYLGSINTDVNSGAGANGRIIFSVTCPTYATSSTNAGANTCPGVARTITLSRAGAGNIPNGDYVVSYTLSGANTGTYTANMTATNVGQTFVVAGANLANSGNTTITVNSLNSGGQDGCTTNLSSNNTATITVTTPATAGTVTGSTPLCVNATATFTTTGTTGGAWSSSAPLVASVDASTGLVTALTAGSTTITYTVTPTCGGTATATSALTVNALTTAAVTPITTSAVCQNGTAPELTVAGTGAGTLTYAWFSNATNSNTGGTLISTATGTTFTPSIATAGTTYYYATVTGTCGTVASNVVAVQVDPISVGGAISGGTAVCAPNNSVTLTLAGNTGTVLMWQSSTDANFTSPSNIGATGQTYPTNNLTTKNYYRAEVKSGACPSVYSDIDSITIIPLVTAGTVSGTSSICYGTPTQFSTTGTSGGTWSSANTSIATVNAAGQVTAVAAGTTNITYTVVNPTCGGVASSSAPVTVLNNIQGTIISAGNVVLCEGQNPSIILNLTGTPTFSGTFSIYKVEGNVETFAGTHNFTATNSGSGVAVILPNTAILNETNQMITYVVRLTSLVDATNINSASCAALPTSLGGQVYLDVYPSPEMTAVLTSAAELCTGGNVAITTTNTTGVPATYKVTAVYPNGVTGNVPALGTPGQAFGTFNDVLTSTNLTAATTVTYTFTPIANGTGGCNGDPKTVTVTVNPLPAFTFKLNNQNITSGNTYPVCQAANTTLQITGLSTTTAYTYAITRTVGSTTTPYASGNIALGAGETTPYSFTSGVGDIGQNNGTAGTYAVTVTNSTTNCSSTQTFTIDLKPKPVFVFKINGGVANEATASQGPNVNTICQAAPTTFQIAGVGEGTYNYVITHQNGSNPATTYTSGTLTAGITNDGETTPYTFTSGVGDAPLYANSTAGTYVITLTNTATNCSASRTYVIEMNPKPTFDFAVNNNVIANEGNTTICAATSTTFKIQNATPGYLFHVEFKAVGSSTYVDYTPNFNASPLAINNNGEFVNTFISGGANNANPTAGEYRITLKNNVTGCVSTKWYTVNVNPKPEFVFQVNADGLDDGETKTICQAASTTFQITGVPSGNYAYVITHQNGSNAVATYATGNITTGSTPVHTFTSGVGDAPTYANSTAGTYVVTVTNTATGCSASRTYEILMNPKPVFGTATTAAVCEGTPATISLAGLLLNTDIEVSYTMPNNATVLTATVNGGTTGTASFTTPNVTLAGGNVTITQLEVVATECIKTYSTPVALIVNANPTLATVTTAPVCAGTPATVTLTGLLSNTAGEVEYTHSLLSGIQTAYGTSSNTGTFEFVTPNLPAIANGSVGTIVKITNANGCVTNFTGKTVTFVVNEAPAFAATTATVTVDADATCQAVVNYALPLITSVSPTATPVITYKITGATEVALASGNGTGTTFNKGTSTVTVYATNTCGQATYTLTVNVVDNTKPALSVIASDVYLNVGAANCTVTMPNYTAGLTKNVTVSDNCSAPANITLTQLAPNHNGSTVIGHGGTRTVYIRAVDENNNADTVSFTLHLVDSTAPNVITKPATVYLDAQGNGTINVANVNNGSIDSCSGIVAMSVSPTTVNCTDATNGTVTVTLTATDLYGNTATNTAIVTVIDNIAPVLPASLPDTTMPKGPLCTNVLGDFTHRLSYGPNGNITEACGILSIVQSPNAATIIGANTSTVNVTLTVRDIHNNVSNIAFNVTLTDTTRPVFTASPANLTANVNAASCMATVTWTAPTASDNCVEILPNTVSVSLLSPATLPANNLYPVGETFITYRAIDGRGNMRDSTFKITVVDNIFPTFNNLPANMTVQTGASATTCGATVNWTAPTGSDNCTQTPVAIAYTVTGAGAGLANGASFPVGVSTVNYTATDNAGNVTPGSFTVTVNDNTNPVINGGAAIANVSVTPNNAGCSATGITLPTVTASDNCAIQSLSIKVAQGANTPVEVTPSQLSSYVFPLGTSTVTYTALDVNGNTVTSNYTVTVNNNLTASIFGTTSIPQNVSTTSNVTFLATGGSGTGNYVFTYTVNNGPQQTITSPTPVVTVPQSNAVLGTYTYVLTGVTRTGTGCTGLISSTNNTAVITVVPFVPVADLYVNTDIGANSFSTNNNIASRPYTLKVGNLLTAGTSAAGVIVTLTNPAPGFFSFALDNNATAPGWVLTPSSGGNYVLMNPTMTLQPGNEVNVYLNLNMVINTTSPTPAGTATVTNTVVPATGEVAPNISNNVALFQININP